MPIASPTLLDTVKTDRQALVTFYVATDGYNWALHELAKWSGRDNIKWTGDASLEERFGVTNNEDGRVVALELETLEIVGSYRQNWATLRHWKP